MATAEEILAGMTAEETQQVLVIDNDLRRITIPEGVTLLGVTSDDDVRRLRFSMPRMYGEVDLSAFVLRINYLNAGNEGDRYPVADAEVDGDTIRFSWLVGRHACKYKGDVRFIVCAKLTGDGGEIEKEFNTTLATLPVLEGLETGEAIVQAHPDVIEAILKRLDTLEQESGGVSSDAIAAAVEAYLTEHPVEAGATAEQAAQIEANRKAIEELKQSSTGGITQETDPTVPAWAKQHSKPTYTAGEVGARPDTWMPSASDVGAEAAGTASAQVGAHNTSGAAHADLRALIEGLNNRLNALADSDDTTLDQLSEIVAYIKSNKALIDAVTTGKVSVSDIVDNLTTNASGKVLSAAQGVALKAMIDGIVIPTALPNPQPITINGQRYDGSEAVTVTVSSEGGGTPVEIDDTLTQSGKAADAKVVGDQLSALNEAKANNDDLAAVAKSGSYNDLTNKPKIPTVPSALPNPNALTFTGAVNETYDGSAAKSVAIPTVPESLKNPNKLTFTGAVTAEYDGSAPVSVEIPAGGGPAYELPVASPTTLGGVMPAAKTDEMTQAVGVDAQGGLWTMAGGGEEWVTLGDFTLNEEVSMVAINWTNNEYPFTNGRVYLIQNTLVGAEGATEEFPVNQLGVWPGFGTDNGTLFGKGYYKTPIAGSNRSFTEVVYAFRQHETSNNALSYVYYMVDFEVAVHKVGRGYIDRSQGVKFSTSGIFGVGSRFKVLMKDL